MPDVIIKSMEMPESCRGCVMYDTMSCRILRRDVYRHAAIAKDRPEDCPLRPAPDGSGRLTPQKPQRNTRCGMGDVYHDYLCPGCSRLLAYEPAAAQHYAEKYCWSCGQAIDWSEASGTVSGEGGSGDGL